MNDSLRKRFFLWLSATIIVASLFMAGVTVKLNFDDAEELQDIQLRQVAVALAAQPRIAPVSRFLSREHEDAEAHFVIRMLGSGDVDPDPWMDVFLPATLHEGLQSLKAADVGWRVMVARNAGGQRFGVAQLQWVRDEVVRDSSVEALVPVLVLVPLLLLIVNLLLRQGFAPLVKLSGEIDRDDGQLRQLESHGIPSEVLPLVQAVNRLLMRLDGTLAQQQRMVANAAHEMRTPVAAARVQADNLAHAELPVEARARLESLQLGLARLSELVEQLLGFARVQSSAPVVDQLVALDELISAAVEETLVFAESRQIDLGCIRLDHARVRGDPSRAYALIRNAIDNAVRYTPAGGRVDLNLMADGGEAVFAIEDTGPGIPAELREQAFEPFFRIVGSRQSGSGLGLAIVRSAAQALGGGVELTERLDGKAGLRFVYRQRLASGVVHRPLGSPNP